MRESFLVFISNITLINFTLSFFSLFKNDLIKFALNNGCQKIVFGRLKLIIIYSIIKSFINSSEYKSDELHSFFISNENNKIYRKQIGIITFEVSYIFISLS